MASNVDLKKIVRWVRGVRRIDGQTVAVRLSSEVDFATDTSRGLGLRL